MNDALPSLFVRLFLSLKLSCLQHFHTNIFEDTIHRMENYKVKYTPLEDNDSVVSGGEVDVNIGQLSNRQRPRWALRLFSLFPWALALVFALLSLGFYIRQYTLSPLGTYEAGFHTDFSMFTQSVRY